MECRRVRVRLGRDRHLPGQEVELVRNRRFLGFCSIEGRNAMKSVWSRVISFEYQRPLPREPVSDVKGRADEALRSPCSVSPTSSSIGATVPYASSRTSFGALSRLTRPKSKIESHSSPLDSISTLRPGAAFCHSSSHSIKSLSAAPDGTAESYRVGQPRPRSCYSKRAALVATPNPRGGLSAKGQLLRSLRIWWAANDERSPCARMRVHVAYFALGGC